MLNFYLTYRGLRMAITAISRDTLSQTVDIVRITSSDNLASVGTTGYILAQKANIEALNNGFFDWLVSDFVLVYASDGWGFFSIAPTFHSLIPFSFSMSVVGTPVVVGDFAIFQSTSGNIEDLGYSPSNASKTKVVMANGAVTVGNIAVYEDTAGTIGQNAADAINGGNIQAGLSGTPGTLISFPGTASKGSLIVAGVANTGNTNTTISNASMGQASVVSIPDPGTATADFVLAPAALVNGNFVSASGTAGLVSDSTYGVNNIVQYASVPITAAQFNGMYAAPFLLLPAPGAGNLIMIDRMELVMTFGTADYAAGGVVAGQYGSTVHGAGVLATNTEAAADFFASASTTFAFTGTSGNTVGALPFSTTVNTGVYLSNTVQPFTTGDSTWTAKIHYRIIAA